MVNVFDNFYFLWINSFQYGYVILVRLIDLVKCIISIRIALLFIQTTPLGPPSRSLGKGGSLPKVDRGWLKEEQEPKLINIDAPCIYKMMAYHVQHISYRVIFFKFQTQARISFTTCPCTSVKRKSLP